MELSTPELPSGASTPEATPSTPITQASTATPASNPSSSKPSTSIGFTAEIQQMMFGLGDCRKPLIESATLIEHIVHQQLILALYKAEDIAKQRNGRFIGIEDFLFLLRKDKVKLRRLIKFLELKDLKKTMYRQSEDDIDSIDADYKTHMKKRRKICYDFLSTIDQTGELTACMEEEDYFDEVKHQRALRAELNSQEMDVQQYIEFSAARQTSFIGRYKGQKFRDWLLQGISLDIKPNPFAVETLNYFAYETVGQMVDLALIVKRDIQSVQENPMTKIVPQVMVNYGSFQNVKGQMPPPASVTAPSGNSSLPAALKSPSSVPSSPLSSPPVTPNTSGLGSSLNMSGGSSKAKPSKKKKKSTTAANRELHNSQAITVAHIHEAMRRYGQNIGPFADFVKWHTISPKQRLLAF